MRARFRFSDGRVLEQLAIDLPPDKTHHGVFDHEGMRWFVIAKEEGEDGFVELVETDTDPPDYDEGNE